MPESNLAVIPQQPAAIIPRNAWEDSLDLVAKTVAPGLNAEEFQLFCYVARVRHLDPLQRQIHAVKRRSWNSSLNGGKGGYEEKMTIQTGIDGYRSIANRTGVYMPSDKPAIIEGAGSETMRITMHVKKFHLLSNTWHEFSATAYYREFVQTRKDESNKPVPNSMWEKMPVNQLTKCAEALALRKGWPEELGGIYVDEEMQHADSPQYLPPQAEPPKQDKTKRELGTMKTSSEPNRGHGKEGTQQNESTICAECRKTNGHTDDCKLNPKNKPGGKKKTREIWDNYEGHDPKIHISFNEFLQMKGIEEKLGLKGAEGDQKVKDMLDREFEIQHRPHIRQDQFQLILDTLLKNFGPKEAESDGSIPSDPEGLFDRP
jgi:phage recombination protein Bet